MLGKTLNSEILKNNSGRVRVAKKKFGSGRVAGTRQTLPKEGTVVVLSSLTQLRRLEESDQSGNQPVLIFKTGFTHNLATEWHL